MDEETAAIRQEIADTREQIGETIEKLAHRADVKSRAKDWAAEKKDAVQDRVEHTKEAVMGRASAAKDAVASRVSGDGAPSREDRLVATGRAGLSGARAKMARRVSSPVAARTGLTERQVEAIIGGVFLALAVIQFVSLVRRTTNAWRHPD